MENVNQTEEKRCPVCGGVVKQIYENATVQVVTKVFALMPDYLSMEIFECENCRRLEFYNNVPSCPASEIDPNEMITCPECGQEHSKHINCPYCLAEKGFKPSPKFEADKEKKTRRKKNDVPWEL